MLAPVWLERREEIYRAYWQFAAERQRIFLRRAVGAPAPWTDDPILRRFKFCNSYRASDRVSQYLIREVIYDSAADSRSADDTVARIVFFRLFSRIETWEALKGVFGPFSRATLRGPRLGRELDRLRLEGPIYTGAFILCANRSFGHARKHENHIALVRSMLSRGRLPRAIARSRSLADLYAALADYPLIGPFMAYQLAIDINYSELVDFSEDGFTVPGPGAERGIRKVFPGARRAEMADVIRWMVAHQQNEAARLGIDLPTLFGRPLRAVDCQNLFCELDKYARVRFPHLRSARSRIKAGFRPNPQPLRLFYPPKWRLRPVL